MKRVGLAVALAFVLWTVMFSPWTAPHLNFWVAMSISAAVLMTIATLVRPSWPRDLKWNWSNVALGVVIAVVLWGVFWVGDKVATWMFPFARPQVDTIYSMKESRSGWSIALLLLFIIGPAEEIFWRGFVQRTISKRWSANTGFVVTLLVYGLVHVWKFNFMLIMSAFVCGLIWGLAYRLWPKQLFALIVSHAVWDALVFVIWPI